VSVKSVLITAAISLVVVIGYDKARGGALPGFKVGV
jgi:hypothetical protein